MELPFLIVHGAIVWKVVLVLLVAGTCAAVWGIRRWRARRIAHRRIAARNASAVAPNEGDVTLFGILRGGSIAMLEREDRKLVKLVGKPWLDCNGARVQLPSDLTVVCGSREWRSWRIPKGAPPSLVEAASRTATGPAALHQLSDGDSVTVQGKLAQCPADDEGDYRETRVAWKFEPEASIAAAQPRGMPRAHHPIGIGAFVVTIAVAYYVAMLGIGDAALKRIDDVERPAHTAFGVAALADWTAMHVAAAMPGSRDKALGTLAWTAEFRRERSPAGAAFADQVDRLLGNTCAVSRHFEELHFERALEIARRCGDGRSEQRALEMLGEYERAADHPNGNTDVVIAIGAGRWKQAAELAEAEAVAQVDSAAFDAAFQRKRSTRARCMAALFRHHAGLPVPTFSAADPFCDIVGALMAPREQQLGRLELVRVESPAGLSLLLADIRAAAGAPPERYHRGGLRETMGLGTVPWLSRFAGTHAEYEHDRFALDFLIDPQKARASYDRLPTARDMSHDDDENRVFMALRLGAPVEETSGDLHPMIEHGYAARLGKRPARQDVMVYPECDAMFEPAFDAAIAGDGGPLAKVLRECPAVHTQIFDVLFGVLPRIHKNRDALVEIIPHLLGSTASEVDYEFPTKLISRAALARDLLRVAGDEQAAAKWQRIVTRHATVLSDRDQAIAIFLWHERF